MEKTQGKVAFYDKLSLSESTLAIFILFGLVLTTIAMGLGYFNGNSGGASVPAGIEKRENRETEAFAEDEGRQKPEYETEKFDNVNE